MQIELLKRKGVFPYDYISSLSKLDVTPLPEKDSFYSKLYDNNITDDEYNHARKVWMGFNVKTLGEYSDIYLKTDVLLLANVFKDFRNNWQEAYNLDPAHYYTTPGLSWNTMLKYAQVLFIIISLIQIYISIFVTNFSLYISIFITNFSLYRSNWNYRQTLICCFLLSEVCEMDSTNALTDMPRHIITWEKITIQSKS